MSNQEIVNQMMAALGWMLVAAAFALVIYKVGGLALQAIRLHRAWRKEKEAVTDDYGRPSLNTRLGEYARPERDRTTEIAAKLDAQTAAMGLTHDSTEAQCALLTLIADRIEAQTSAITNDRLSISGSTGEFQAFLEKKHAMTMAALDALIETQETSAKAQREFLRVLNSMFGNAGGPGYTDMTEEQESLREKAERLQKRYNCTWDEAMRHAKESQIYEPNGGGGMRERV